MTRRRTSAPTREQFEAAVERARTAGQRAAEERHLELAWRIEAQAPLLEACGVALLTVKADGRSGLGKLLGTLARDPIPGVSVTRIRRAEYMVSVQGTSRYQGQSVNEAAERTVFAILKHELGIEGYVRKFVD